MVRFQSKKITPQVTRIYGINGEQMYLIEGSEQAALIDTASGAGDLKAYVESLTSLPLIVLLTHGHVDHAMGAPQFPDVFMSFLDSAVYQEMSSLDWRKAYLSPAPAFGELTDADFLPDAMYVPVETAENFRDLKDGDVFDLGGITVETIFCGGHTPGTMLFLLREPRILITGDGCAFFTMLQADSCLGLSSYEKNLRAAEERTRGRYDQVLMSHGNLEAPVTLMEEVLECIQEIKNGTDDKIAFGFMGTGGRVAKAYGNNGVSAYARLDGKVGNIVYNPDRIWE